MISLFFFFFLNSENLIEISTIQDIKQIKADISSTTIEILEDLLTLIDLGDKDTVENLKEIFGKLFLIGNTSTVEDFLDFLKNFNPELIQSPGTINMIYRFIHSLGSLMSGKHYEVRRIYDECPIDDKYFQVFLKDVQCQIREVLRQAITFNWNIEKLKSHYESAQVKSNFDEMSIKE